MANFATPFASTGPRRTPNADEKANGFPCGPADQTLFNGMFHRIEAELGDLITFAGLVPTDAQYNQVRLAVQALIASATGGGEAEDYVLINQLTARLPIFPELLTGDGRMNITSPANGIVRVPGGITILHRGVSPHVTVQTDFDTVASRTYHLRWNPTDGLNLQWVGSNIYNPLGVSEDDPGFDSNYNDVLLARVITSSTNVPTILPLANKSQLTFEGVVTGTNGQLISQNGSRWDFNQTLAWARRPTTFSIAIARNSTGPGLADDHDFNISLLGTNPEVSATNISVNRYRWQNTIMRDGSQDLDMHFSARA